MGTAEFQGVKNGQKPVKILKLFHAHYLVIFYSLGLKTMPSYDFTTTLSFKYTQTKDVGLSDMIINISEDFSAFKEGKAIHKYLTKYFIKKINASKQIKNAIKAWSGVVEDTQGKIDDLRRNSQNLQNKVDSFSLFSSLIEKEIKELEKSQASLELYIKTSQQLIAQGARAFEDLINSESVNIIDEAKEKSNLKLKRNHKIKVISYAVLTIVIVAASITAAVLAGGGTVAIVGAVIAGIVSTYGAYDKIHASINKNWESENKSVKRINQHFDNLNDTRDQLEKEFNTLELAREIRRKAMKKQFIKLETWKSELNAIKCKSDIANKAKKTMQELEKNITNAKIDIDKFEEIESKDDEKFKKIKSIITFLKKKV